MRGSYGIQVGLGFPGVLERLLAATAQDVADLFPNSLRALSALAEAAQRRWIALASGEIPLPSGERLHRRTGQYAESIQLAVENPQGGIRYVVFSDDPKAPALEWGRPAWDMREVLHTSRKVRRAKDGHLYLIIPFRWGTPGTLVVGAYAGREIPMPVYSFWLSPFREDSYVTGTYEEEAVHYPGETVTRYRYHWGDRLTPRDVRALGLDPGTAPGKHLVGMVRMRNPEDPRLGSQYLTFRTLSERSKDGWIHPGTPAYGVAKAVYDWLMGIYPELMERALQADVERLKRKAGEG